MENLFSLFKSLVPDLTKDRLLEDLRATRTMLEDLHDVYRVAAPQLRNYNFQAKEVKERIDKFKRLVGVRENPIAFFEKNIPVIIKNLDYIKKAISDENRVFVESALTVRQANLLSYVTALYLVNKGARKFLVWIEAHESANYNRTISELVNEITPAEEEWLKNAFVEFCQAARIVTMAPEKTEARLDTVVDAQANEKALRALQAANRTQSADPLSLGFIGTKWNPILFVRMLVAEWQVSRYNESEEELQGLRLQLARLENTSKGKNDPKLEKEISYMRDRVNKKAQEILEMEQKYA